MCHNSISQLVGPYWFDIVTVSNKYNSQLVNPKCLVMSHHSNWNLQYYLNLLATTWITRQLHKLHICGVNKSVSSALFREINLNETIHKNNWRNLPLQGRYCSFQGFLKNWLHFCFFLVPLQEKPLHSCNSPLSPRPTHKFSFKWHTCISWGDSFLHGRQVSKFQKKILQSSLPRFISRKTEEKPVLFAPQICQALDCLVTLVDMFK